METSDRTNAIILIPAEVASIPPTALEQSPRILWKTKPNPAHNVEWVTTPLEDTLKIHQMFAEHPKLKDKSILSLEFARERRYARDFRLTVSEDGLEVDRILRINLPIYPYYRTESEAMTMKMVAKNFPEWSTPVLEWSSTPDSILGYEWILMPYTKGREYNDIKKYLSKSKKISIMNTLNDWAMLHPEFGLVDSDTIIAHKKKAEAFLEQFDSAMFKDPQVEHTKARYSYEDLARVRSICHRIEKLLHSPRLANHIQNTHRMHHLYNQHRSPGFLHHPNLIDSVVFNEYQDPVAIVDWSCATFLPCDFIPRDLVVAIRGPKGLDLEIAKLPFFLHGGKDRMINGGWAFWNELNRNPEQVLREIFAYLQKGFIDPRDSSIYEFLSRLNPEEDQEDAAEFYGNMMEEYEYAID
ncbi:hypothetical protein PT974_02022 [Cladobotryum mycophilum]|uniref:Aminoglycoside phosphotransferase domain-containing protein n=1 Tax=Cladobotryum mycophilum TaxID=491253 RepID=A0ABR0SX25_9HYPO